MMRYLRLYLHFVRFSFSKAMEFRIDFFFRVVMDLFFYVTQFLFFNIIYLHTPLLAGWNLEQMSLFIASFIFIDALHMTIFATNAWWFPIAINRGNLDYYLTKPVSSFFFISLKEFAANSMINLILASGLLTYFLCNYSGGLDPGRLSLYFIFLLNGTVLYFMVHIIFLMTVFWTQSPQGFADVFYAAEKVFQRPDKIFTGYVRRFFVYVLPFSIMASYPVRILFEKNISTLVLEILVPSCFIYLVVFFVWKKGLRNYSSASS